MVIGDSKPALPPIPTVNELVIIWANICFLGMIPRFLATAYIICEVPFSIEPSNTFLMMITVMIIPMIGKVLLLKGR